MPTYEYLCRSCAAPFDVICSISRIDSPVVCPKCAAANDRAARQLARTNCYGGKAEDAVFDPAFGMVIKSTKHRRDEAKARGWIELGNEKPEAVHEHFDKARAETRAERWREADRDKVYD